MKIIIEIQNGMLSAVYQDGEQGMLSDVIVMDRDREQVGDGLKPSFVTLQPFSEADEDARDAVNTLYGSQNHYWPLSPDGLPLTCEVVTFETDRLARIAIIEWMERYRAQGYYKTASGRRIPFAEIPKHCTVKWTSSETIAKMQQEANEH